MRFIFLPACAIAAALLVCSTPARSSTDDARLVAAAQALAIRIDGVTRDIARASNGSDSVDVRLHRLHADLDELSRSLPKPDDGSPGARKLHALSLLLGNLDRARSTGHAPRLPHRPQPSRRGTLSPTAVRLGGTCSGAIALASGQELDGELGAEAELWLRVDVGSTVVRVDTYASTLDTEIGVFDACPEDAGRMLAGADDTFGLAAAVSVRAGTEERTRWLRVRNLGAGGSLSVVAGAGGSVSGHVRDFSGQPIGSSIYAYSAGFLLAVANTDAGGYEIPLDAGDYAIVSAPYDGVTMMWPNVECSGRPSECNLALAQTVTVEEGATTAGIDFTHGPGARIIGRARDAATGLPVPNAIVMATNALGLSFYAAADATGRYQIGALAAGEYHVVATEPGHLSQLYDRVDCPVPPQSCDPSGGAPVILARDTPRQGIDFILRPMPTIDVLANVPVGGPADNVEIRVFDVSGNLVFFGYAPSGQRTRVGPLVPGSYRVAARSFAYAAQLYDHVDCIDECYEELASGTPLTIAFDAAAPLATFDLRELPDITGRVTDLVTGAGLANVDIALYEDAVWILDAVSAADGTYVLDHVPPGNYWIKAVSVDHRDTAFPAAACSDYVFDITSCQLASARQVAVGVDAVSGIDIALPPNGTIAGTVQLRGLPATPPQDSAHVVLYDTSGAVLKLVSANYNNGDYVIGDVAPGTYFLEAVNTELFAQVFSGIDCPVPGVSCDPTAGTPVAMLQGQAVQDVDFSLVSTQQISGRVTDAVSGAGIAGAVVDMWSSTQAHCGASATDADGYYMILAAACPGPVALSTDAGTAYVDEVFDGHACPNGPAYEGLCSLADATPVAFPTQPDPVVVDFALDARDPDMVFASGFDPSPAMARQRVTR
ncbi:carboxypeptidase regulatory-like domain-containing protein [Dokdonella sp.]|uniref:carboxypeptidase regulatory-like domain-containing protein n=1 Tax=Dokdonella sp. TaxID=2291710 RepID=UPI002F3F0661